MLSSQWFNTNWPCILYYLIYYSMSKARYRHRDYSNIDLNLGFHRIEMHTIFSVCYFIFMLHHLPWNSELQKTDFKTLVGSLATSLLGSFSWLLWKAIRDLEQREGSRAPPTAASMTSCWEVKFIFFIQDHMPSSDFSYNPLTLSP